MKDKLFCWMCVGIIVCLGFQVYNLHLDALFFQDVFREKDSAVHGDVFSLEYPNTYSISTMDYTIKGIQIWFEDIGMDEGFKESESDEAIYVTLSSEDEDIYTWEVNEQEINYENYTQFELERKYRLSQKKIDIKISTDLASDLAHVAVACDSDREPCIRLTYGFLSAKWSLLVVASFVFMIFILTVLVISKVQNEIVKFSLVLAIIGVCYIIVVPFTEISDGLSHVIRAFEVTEGNLYTHDQADQDAYLPDGILAGLNYQDSYSTIFLHRNDTLNYDYKYYYNHNNTALYAPIAYFPQIIGIWLIKLFTKKALVIIFFARIFALAAYIAMVCYAYKHCPVNRGIIVAVALLPIALIEAGSPSLDSFVIAFLIWGQAYILSICVRNKKMTRLQMILLWLCPIIFTLCKVVYFPFALLLLLVPKECYGSRNTKCACVISSFAISVAVYLSWSALSADFINEFTAGVADSSAQIRFVLTHPLSFINIFRNTVRTMSVNYILGTFGGIAGWAQNIGINVAFPIFYIPFLFVMLLFQPDSSLHRNLKVNVMYAMIVMLTLALTFAALYVQFNAVAAPLIDGIQGRYFVPLLFPAGVVLGSGLKYIYRDRLVKSSHEDGDNETYRFSHYFYLFVVWMNMAMVLEMIKDLWH
ncbi:MAG: DUF2142 domain-containing protein [Lachnospiraceae bacterium]|nr:DUF2142 domain-containing protein [Lachnospiraceae bacterium]